MSNIRWTFHYTCPMFAQLIGINLVNVGKVLTETGISSEFTIAQGTRIAWLNPALVLQVISKRAFLFISPVTLTALKRTSISS